MTILVLLFAIGIVLSTILVFYGHRAPVLSKALITGYGASIIVYAIEMSGISEETTHMIYSLGIAFTIAAFAEEYFSRRKYNDSQSK